jgi:hypothetical protein
MTDQRPQAWYSPSEGWIVTHHLSTSAPVRVRVRDRYLIPELPADAVEFLAPRVRMGVEQILDEAATRIRLRADHERIRSGNDRVVTELMDMATELTDAKGTPDARGFATMLSALTGIPLGSSVPTSTDPTPEGIDS